MEKENKIKYILYARKSSEDKSKQIQSIESQIQVMKEFAKKENLEIVEIMHEEKSGKTPGRRIVFANMIKLIESGKANGILVWKLDRIARNLLEGGRIIDMLQNGVIREIRTPEEKHLPTDNVYSIAIQLCGANQYSRDLSTNVKRGLRDKLNKGWRPGTAPIGYLNSKIKDRGDNDIYKDPERFPLIRKMWDLMLTGNYTPPQIVEIANNKWGFRTIKTKRMGGVPLSKSGIYRIFNNIFYAGIIEHLGQQYDGKHEKMITLEEFDIVQKLLGKKGNTRLQKHKFAYSGVFHCDECGCAHVFVKKIKLIKSTGKLKEFTYCYCTRRKRNSTCDQKEVLPIENLEIQIEKEIDKFTIIPDFLNWALEDLSEEDKEEIESQTKIYETQQKALTQMKDELNELGVMRRRQLINDEDFLKGKKELETKIAKLEQELAQVDSNKEKLVELTKKTFRFATYAHIAFLRAQEQGENGLELKKEIVTTVGKYPKIRNKKLIIEPNEWFIPIENDYPVLLGEYLRLEPTKIGDFENKKEALASIRARWRGQGDLNPRSPP